MNQITLESAALKLIKEGKMSEDGVDVESGSFKAAKPHQNLIM